MSDLEKMGLRNLDPELEQRLLSALTELVIAGPRETILTFLHHINVCGDLWALLGTLDAWSYRRSIDPTNRVLH